MDNRLKTLDDCELGDILYDEIDPRTGLRGLIIRGPFSFCAYVGAPRDHLLDGIEDLNIDCHFGLNYSGWGDGFRPVDWFWWGWDYGHFTDMTTMADMLLELLPKDIQPEFAIKGPSTLKMWSVGEIEEQVKSSLDELAAQLSAAKIYTGQVIDFKIIN